MENQGASGETQAGSQTEGDPADGVTGGAGEGQGQASGEEAAQGATGGAEGQAEGDVEVVEKDGKHFIPKERFDQIYGKMKQFESVFEAIQSDPDARRQFIESLGDEKGDEGNSQQVAAANRQPTAFEQFLTQTPALANSPEHQSLFNNFGRAVANDLETYLKTDYISKADFQKAIAPLMRYVGSEETSRFYEKNPQAKTYEMKIVDVMRQHPTLTLQQAFLLASSTDNKIRAAGEQKAKQNQERLNNTPITGKTNSGGGQTKQPLPSGDKGISEGIRRAFAGLGIKD